jgi:hypothetical protein
MLRVLYPRKEKVFVIIQKKKFFLQIPGSIVGVGGGGSKIFIFHFTK